MGRPNISAGNSTFSSADRFRLISHGSFTIGSILLFVPFCGWILERPPREAPLVLAVMITLAAYGVVCLTLALAQPEAYARRVRERAAA